MSEPLAEPVLLPVPPGSYRTDEPYNAGATFKQNCRLRLSELARNSRVALGQFLIGETKRLTFEARAQRVTAEQARELPSEERDSLIKVFIPGNAEPVSIVDVPHSVLGKCSEFACQAFRIYFVSASDDPDSIVDRLRATVAEWHVPE